MSVKKPKIEKVFFSIGEVSAMVDISPPTIRYWESCFDELKPAKSSKGTRMYNHDDIETIRLINYLVNERGLTTKGVRLKLKNSKQKTLETWEIVKQLQKIKKELNNILEELEESYGSD